MSEELKSSVVRIFSEQRAISGAGFLIADGYILTCAHVVAQALGIRSDSPQKPEGQVTLDFPLLAPGHLLAAQVVAWKPVLPPTDSPLAQGEDMAVLRLGEPAPERAVALPLRGAEEVWGHTFRAFGFPAGYDRGVWASGVLRAAQTGGWVQIEDTKAEGYFIAPGFSGTPIWDEQVQGVVGMVVGSDKHTLTKAAVMIPTSQFFGWDELRPCLGEKAAPAARVTGRLKEAVWDRLLSRIKAGTCTPFLGAGASYPAFPLASELALKWAQKYGYPLDNPGNLKEVAQFLAVQYDPLFPKEKMLEEMGSTQLADLRDPDEPHRLLAELPLAVYLTTNYDDFMVRALKSCRIPRDPRRELCQWNETLQEEPSIFDTPYTPSPANPLVFHLHGYGKPESLVLTEDDYLLFLANIARNPDLLPKPVKDALDRSMCLFIGYRLADWNFRILFQGLRATFGRRRATQSVIVLRPPHDSHEADKQQEYLERYYGALDVQVYWGTAREFTAELRQRWEAFSQT